MPWDTPHCLVWWGVLVVIDLWGHWSRNLASADRWRQWTAWNLVGAVLGSSSEDPEDAAIGLVLSTFFGLGIVLLSVVQTNVSTQTAGLDSYIYGQASTMTKLDVLTLASLSLLVVLTSILLRNPFGQVCFDADFAATTGWPVDRIDLLMMGLVAGVCVIGIPAVGLMLVVALLIVPCAAARLWSTRLIDVLMISGLFGGIAGWLGRGSFFQPCPTCRPGPSSSWLRVLYLDSALFLRPGVAFFQANGILTAGISASLKIMLWNISLTTMTLSPMMD